MRLPLTAISASMLTVLLLGSCRKEQQQATVTKNVEVALNVNETYTYSLPGATATSGLPVITVQAAHYATSNIKAGSLAKTSVLTYIPADDYTGTDELVVNAAGAPENFRQGGCKTAPDTTYFFKITVAKIK